MAYLPIPLSLGPKEMANNSRHLSKNG
jgi:hypothetical protein